MISADDVSATLIEILLATIRRVSTGEVPHGRVIPKRIAKDMRQSKEEKTRYTEALIPFIAGMVEKFKRKHKPLSALLEIPLLFDLELYTTKGRESVSGCDHATFHLFAY